MRRLTTTERWLPFGYLSVAIALVAVALPTALRPPQAPPPSAAEFSPDAPPEDNEVVLTELSRGLSGTAGVGTGDGSGGDDAPLEAANPLIEFAPRKGRCFGDPPRQTESLYAAGCAPAWTGGDNGGATSKGVTATEIRIGVVIGNTDADYEGPLRDPHDNETDTEVQLRTWQSYFNERYEFFGRRIRLVLVKIALTDDPQTAKGKFGGAEQQWPMFGFYGAGAIYPAIEEAIRLKTIVFDEAAENPHSFFVANRPFFYSFRMDADKIVRIHTEIMCKQLVGKPPEFNRGRDPTFDYNAPRKFGLLLYEDTVRSGSQERINEGLGKCGEKLTETVKFNLYDNQSSLAAAMTRMRAQGVTTVLVGGDSITPIAFTNEAQNSGYFPEWWNFGAGGMEGNGAGRLYHRDQWQHAIGAFYTEMPRPSGYGDCDVAFRSQNPDESPGACGSYRQLQQFANGIQGAGPNLNPDTFFEGLKKIPCRAPEPEWSIGGCYGDNDFTYPDYQGLVWWDPNGKDPNSSVPGAYQWVYGGKRFAEGEIPTERVPWFDEGITTPPDPVQSQ